MVAFDKARYGIDSYLEWLKNEGLRVVEGLGDRLQHGRDGGLAAARCARARRCISMAAAISAT